MSPLLDTMALTVRYGGVVAVSGVDLSVEEGHIVGLIGPNGAGKTSFIDALSGMTPSSGTICFDGQDLSKRPPHRRAKAGLVRTWQSIELFEDLSVRENLQVALERESTFDLLVDMVLPQRRHGAGHEEALISALDLVGARDLADRYPSELSQGQRKMVGVARALAQRPRLVCMDEPAAGLDSEESRRFGARLRQIVQQGTSILLVDHDMGLVFDVCDELYVLNFGVLLAHGPTPAVRDDPAVIEAYLGRSDNDEGRHGEQASGKTAAAGGPE